MNNKIHSNEIDKLIDDVSQKFGYEEELNSALKRIVPYMIDGKSEEVKSMLFDTLNRVKIFVLPYGANREDIEKCQNEIFVKQNVTFVEPDRGEYDNGDAKGGYVDEAIFDENMNIVGRQSYIAITKLSKYSDIAKIYDTDINLSHLIHELGHAWAAEKDEFVQKENGDYVCNIGTYTPEYKVDKQNRISTRISNDGMMIEDALNTIQEEDVLCRVLNINSIDQIKFKGYIPSSYHGLIADLMKSYVVKYGEESFEEYRYFKNKETIKSIEQSLEETEAWSYMQTDDYKKYKKGKINKVNELDITDGAKRLINNLFEKYEEEYFPDNSKFTPMQKLENVFMQIINFGSVKYNIDIKNLKNSEIYNQVVYSMINEGYVMKNQAKEIIKEDNTKEESAFINELKSSVKTAGKADLENKKVGNMVENKQYESR